MTERSTAPARKVVQTGATGLAWTLPASYYHETPVYRAERARIFASSWRLAGHASQLAERGDYLCEDICGSKVVVLRGEYGALRGFHNVCRHRAHRLLDGRAGRAPGAIRCPYHGWTYALDGELLAARHSERIEGFDKRCHGLAPLAVEIFCGFVFVNLDPHARPLAEQAPGFAETLEAHVPDLDRMAPWSRDDFSIGANWKVVVENAIDWYHVYLSGPHHRDFGKLVDRGSVETVCHPGWVMLRAGPGSPDNGAYDFASGTGQTDRYLTLFLWPDLLIFTYPHVNAVWTFLMAPESPERTRQEIAALTPDGAEPDAIIAKAVDWMARAVGPEDAALNEGVQEGLRSVGYDQGPLLIDRGCHEVSEHGVHYFQTRVLEALGELPEDASRALLSRPG